MAPHSVDDLARSFERHLRAQNKSPQTSKAYLEAVGHGRVRTEGCGRGRRLVAVRWSPGYDGESDHRWVERGGSKL